MWSSLVIMVLWAASLACAILWVVPPALHTFAAPAQDVVNATAALILLPEYLVTIARRKRGKAPTRLAYEVGDLVAWGACVAGTLIRGTLTATSRRLSALHPAVVVATSVAVVAGITIGTS
jgi:hypothetical protein